MFHISWWCSRSSWHLGKTYKRQWGKMIQTVYFKLYCYLKMHKMGKLLKNCGGRVLQDNLMKSGPLKISFRDSFMGVNLHYQLRKRWDGDRNALWLQFKTPQSKVCVYLRYMQYTVSCGNILAHGEALGVHVPAIHILFANL